jgi:hypothetical protein
MFISTSDDYEIKVWRSQASVREQGIAEMARANEVRLKHLKKKEEEVVVVAASGGEKKEA